MGAELPMVVPFRLQRQHHKSFDADTAATNDGAKYVEPPVAPSPPPEMLPAHSSGIEVARIATENAQERRPRLCRNLLCRLGRTYRWLVLRRSLRQTPPTPQ